MSGSSTQMVKMLDMKKYNCLLKLKQLKEQFVFDLLRALSSIQDTDLLMNNWKNRNYNSTLKEWSEQLGLDEKNWSLIDKVEHIILRGDFDGAIAMLKSFRKGTKRLRSNVRGNEDYYIWVERGGTEYNRHEKNLPRAHFRWNYGERYTLDWVTIEKNR